MIEEIEPELEIFKYYHDFRIVETGQNNNYIMATHNISKSKTSIITTYSFAPKRESDQLISKIFELVPLNLRLKV